MEYYVDRARRLTFNDVSKRQFSSKFKKCSTNSINNFGNQSIWLKFRVRNDSDEELEWYLENDFIYSDELILYYPDGKGRYESIASNNAPAYRREVNSITFIFPVKTPPGEWIYYLQQNPVGWTSVVPRIWSPKNLITNLVTVNVLHGVFYGILAIMLLYNLFIFLSVREKAYFYYLLQIVGLALIYMTLDGVGINYVWSELLVNLNKRSNTLYYYLGLMPVLLFLKSYLQTKEKAPLVDTQVNCLIALNFILIVLSLTLEPLSQAIYPTIVLNVFILIVGVYNIVVPILHIKKGSRPAKFYLLAVVMLVLGAIPQVFFYLGFAPVSFATAYGPKFGGVCMLALFSFGLADKINTMKNELADLNENLEKKVQLRTGELKEANDKLKELDRAKSDFFTNVSHEIRTPLTLILSPIESVLQKKFSGEVDEEFFRSMHRNAVRLIGLVNSLLDFSKIDAGKMTLSLRMVDMVEFLESRIHSTKDAFDSRGIYLELVSESGALRFNFDPEMMDRIVMNLLSNALKFTERGGAVKVEVGKRGEACRISFADTGCGIPSDRIQSVFERFSRADAGATRKYEGTGIGLALVKEMVSLHGGRMDIQSRDIDNFPEDHGTVVTIELPMDAERIEGAEIQPGQYDDDASRFFAARDFFNLMPPGGVKPPVTDSDAVGGGTPAGGENEKVLVVEDNPDMRELLKNLLHGKYRVFFATNGREGLERAKEISPDLILSDVMMPVMDGYEMTMRLKNDMNLKDIPVIMLTAKADTGSIVEGMEYGADDYVAKPFNADELLTRVKAILRSKNYQRIIARRNREIEEELEIARLIQKQLLPGDTLDLPGYIAEWKYIPLDMVGGDLLSISGDGEYIELFIADVSGHGLPGACLSLITKTAMDSIEDRGSTRSVLVLLNDVICRSTVNYKFVTAFYGRIDARRKVLRFSCAGHYTPFVYRRATGEFIELKAKGIPLGLFSEIEIEEREVQLTPGDRIFLYTDGVIDCMDGRGSDFGEGRMKELIRDNVVLSPREFTEKTVEELVRFRGSGKFNDDVAFIVCDIP
ncbi:MAG: SpoIIE family protein phosphatase [Spirochaetes bacterium]|nr:SpoIIE family protein phosphatase [Spirochaetota bacterium]